VAPVSQSRIGAVVIFGMAGSYAEPLSYDDLDDVTCDRHRSLSESPHERRVIDISFMSDPGISTVRVYRKTARCREASVEVLTIA
jgi:hypothetical protein